MQASNTTIPSFARDLRGDGSIRIYRPEEIDMTERDSAVVSHQQIPIDLPRTTLVSTPGRVRTSRPKFDRC
jgi:hypothetical protein